MQRLASLGLGVGAAGGLAINCDNIGVTVTQAADPDDEALGEQPGVQRVYRVVQRIMAGDAPSLYGRNRRRKAIWILPQ